MTIILQQIEIILFCVLLGWCISLKIAGRKHDYLVVFQVFCENKDKQAVGSVIYSFKKSELDLSLIRKMEKDITKGLQNDLYVGITKVIITDIIKLN